MPQHDMVIANGTGAAVRSDINGALAALVAQNSGSVAPATTYAYQFWADTSAGVMKMRDSANATWITLFQLDGEWSSIAFENGTAAAPSIYFKDSGTDTGFYSPGTDQVGITTGGTARLTFGATGDATFSGNVLLSGTGYIDLPAGTTGERPGSPNNGMIRYNTTLSTFEGYKAGSWGAIGGGATGGGSDDVFYENGQTVTTNYTLTTSKNAMTAGPVTINSGVTVTVPSGQSWVIV